MRRRKRPEGEWGRFFDKCRVSLVDQNIGDVNDVFSQVKLYFSDTKSMHNVVLSNFYGRSLIQFYSGDVQRVNGSAGGPSRHYGSSSRWNSLGSPKLLFIRGMAMLPMITDANMVPNFNLPRARVQDVGCTELKRVPQHYTDWDQPMDNETGNQVQQYEFRSSSTAEADEIVHVVSKDQGWLPLAQEMGVNQFPCSQRRAGRIAVHHLPSAMSMAAELPIFWALEPREMELDHQSTCCQGVPAASEDQHGSMYLTTKMAVEGVVTPAEWTQLEEVVQHLTLAGTRGECEALVCALAQLICLGRQRLGPGGVRQ